jgi:hypothetical protein
MLANFLSMYSGGKTFIFIFIFIIFLNKIKIRDYEYTPVAALLIFSANRQHHVLPRANNHVIRAMSCQWKYLTYWKCVWLITL